MKKLLIGMTLLASISSFAGESEYDLCTCDHYTSSDGVLTGTQLKGFKFDLTYASGSLRSERLGLYRDVEPQEPEELSLHFKQTMAECREAKLVLEKKVICP